ncbi:hypothetical protein BD289DRAFT_338350, partial [Coniella lustricola]
ALLGRRLRPTPPHLTHRILYIPSHNDKVTHLPIYDFTEDFNNAIQDEPIGGSKFKTKFGLMPKPIGDGRGTSAVAYLADFEPPEARRTSVSGGLVGLVIPPVEHAASVVPDGAVACTMSPGSTTAAVPLVSSFPVSPTISRFGSSRNPWFTFTVPSLLDDERTLQWQIHPIEQGMLRYTLVEIPVAAHANEHLIRAIYHNVGLGFSFSQPYSEGALLLQDEMEPELEALIVASLLGLLWRAR